MADIKKFYNNVYLGCKAIERATSFDLGLGKKISWHKGMTKRFMAQSKCYKNKYGGC